MSHRDTRRVGRFEVTAFLDADAPDTSITEAFPDIPPDQVMAAKNAFPGVYTDDDRWRLRIRAWLVRHPGGTLLLDTGIGGATSPTRSWAPTPGVLASAFGEVDLAPGDIDTVAISHVHDDHIGGLLNDDGVRIAPNARYLIQRADVEWLRASAARSEEDEEVWQLVAPLETSGVLDVVDGDHRLAPGLDLRHVPGHTPGHQVLLITDDADRLIISADTWNHPMQLANPDWPSGPDDDHAAAASSRRRLLAEIATHPDAVVAPTHFAEAFGTIRHDADVWSWVPI
jgi:glyoxylase-like metal-dependent hydrolase (beta-lactamase superfamily II)